MRLQAPPSLAARLRGSEVELRRQSGSEGGSRIGSQCWDSDGSDGGRGGHQPARGEPRKSAFAAEVGRTLQGLQLEATAVSWNGADASGAHQEAQPPGAAQGGAPAGDHGETRTQVQAAVEEQDAGERAPGGDAAPEEGIAEDASWGAHEEAEAKVEEVNEIVGELGERRLEAVRIQN